MAPKHILSVNAGSSSLKCKLFQIENDGQVIQSIATIKVSDLNTDKVKISFQPEPKESIGSRDISSHEKAFAYIIEQLDHDDKTYQLEDISDLVVAHRIVHGGNFKHAVEINEKTYHQLEELESLAPL